MAIYRLGDFVPKIHPSAFVHPDATVIGDVEIGAESSVWPHAVLRGDMSTIRIGARTCIQDGSVIHAGTNAPTFIGDGCVVGHLVHLEGCVLEDGSMAGSGSLVLHDCRVGAGATVAANAICRDGTKIPPLALALGVPATIKEGGSHPELISLAAATYVATAKRYAAELHLIG